MGFMRRLVAAVALWCSASAQIDRLFTGDSSASDFVVVYAHDGVALSTIRTFNRLGWNGLVLLEGSAPPSAMRPSKRTFVVHDAKLAGPSSVSVEARVCATARARCAAQPGDATGVSSDSSGEPTFTLGAILSAGWRSGSRSSSLRCLVLDAGRFLEILAADFSSVTVHFILLLNAGQGFGLGSLPDWLGYEVVSRSAAGILLQLRTEPRETQLVRITLPLQLHSTESTLQRVRASTQSLSEPVLFASWLASTSASY